MCDREKRREREELSHDSQGNKSFLSIQYIQFSRKVNGIRWKPAGWPQSTHSATRVGVGAGARGRAGQPRPNLMYVGVKVSRLER